MTSGDFFTFFLEFTEMGSKKDQDHPSFSGLESKWYPFIYSSCKSESLFLSPVLKYFLFPLFNPLVPTTITQAPKDLTVTQGESGIFHCKARGHPAPHIAWALGPNGDQPIPTEDKFKILSSGSLVISHVNLTDQGMYRCVASNPAGSATAAASLTVKGKDTLVHCPNMEKKLSICVTYTWKLFDDIFSSNCVLLSMCSIIKPL